MPNPRFRRDRVNIETTETPKPRNRKLCIYYQIHTNIYLCLEIAQNLFSQNRFLRAYSPFSTLSPVPKCASLLKWGPTPPDIAIYMHSCYNNTDFAVLSFSKQRNRGFVIFETSKPRFHPAHPAHPARPSRPSRPLIPPIPPIK